MSSPEPPGGPGSRREAREQALSIVFEAEIKAVPPDEILAGLAYPVDDFAVALVDGVTGHRDELDAIIEGRSVGWPLARMPTVDRVVLRLGAFELAHRPDVPVAVAISEAVALAKRYSTDDSGRFVNGVLAAVARDLGRSPEPA